MSTADKGERLREKLEQRIARYCVTLEAYLAGGEVKKGSVLDAIEACAHDKFFVVGIAGTICCRCATQWQRLVCLQARVIEAIIARDTSFRKGLPQGCISKIQTFRTREEAAQTADRINFEGIDEGYANVFPTPIYWPKETCADNDGYVWVVVRGYGPQHLREDGSVR